MYFHDLSKVKVVYLKAKWTLNTAYCMRYYLCQSTYRHIQTNKRKFMMLT